MPGLRTISQYGLFLFGIAVVINIGLFFLAMVRG